MRAKQIEEMLEPTIKECRHCKGKGFVEAWWGTTWITCGRCGGEGIVSSTAEESRKTRAPRFDPVAVSTVAVIWGLFFFLFAMLGYSIGA